MQRLGHGQMPAPGINSLPIGLAQLMPALGVRKVDVALVKRLVGTVEGDTEFRRKRATEEWSWQAVKSLRVVKEGKSIAAFPGDARIAAQWSHTRGLGHCLVQSLSVAVYAGGVAPQGSQLPTQNRRLK